MKRMIIDTIKTYRDMLKSGKFDRKEYICACKQIKRVVSIGKRHGVKI